MHAIEHWSRSTLPGMPAVCILKHLHAPNQQPWIVCATSRPTTAAAHACNTQQALGCRRCAVLTACLAVEAMSRQPPHYQTYPSSWALTPYHPAPSPSQQGACLEGLQTSHQRPAPQAPLPTTTQTTTCLATWRPGPSRMRPSAPSAPYAPVHWQQHRKGLPSAAGTTPRRGTRPHTSARPPHPRPCVHTSLHTSPTWTTSWA